jgi:hypothetical protein
MNPNLDKSHENFPKTIYKKGLRLWASAIRLLLAQRTGHTFRLNLLNSHRKQSLNR